MKSRPESVREEEFSQLNLTPGAARCPGVSFEELAARDTHRVPDFLREEAYRYLGSDSLPVERYISPEFHRLEVQRMWPNVWQFAAREEELLGPGQSVVYENAGRSYVLIRQEDGAIRAFHNVCLHRGRKLRDKGGQVKDRRRAEKGSVRMGFPAPERQGHALARSRGGAVAGLHFCARKFRRPFDRRISGTPERTFCPLPP
jgi:hypothetical protein